MSRIISYPYDDSIKAKDAWVGTDEASRQTKQYTAEALAEYLNISGSISIIGQMTYKYGTTPLNGIGTLAVFGGGPDIVAFSAVVKLTLSNQDISNQRVVEFLDLLVGSDILIAEQGAISTFGYYSIDSYAINATDSNYYDLGVTFKSGNGSMRSDRIYEAQNFVLANDATQSPWNTVPNGISYTAANVGIGTTSPTSELHIATASPEIKIEDTSNLSAKVTLDGTRLAQITQAGTKFTISDEVFGESFFEYDAGSSMNIKIGDTNFANETHIEIDDNTARVLIPNGNVGIGTTSPSEKLEVSGGNIKGDGLIQVENAIDNNIIGKLVINYGSSNNPRLSSVGGTEIDFQTDLVIRSNKGLYSDTSSSTGLIIGSQRANTPIKFLTSPTTHLTYSEAMRIAGDGNVGIGTTSPVSKLEVQDGTLTVDNGNINVLSGGISVTRNSANNTGLIVNQQGTADILNLLDNGVEVLTVTDGGNVGIGTTSPSTNLEVVTSDPSNGIKGTTNTGILWGNFINTNSNAFPVGKITLRYGATETVSILARSNEMRLGGSQTQMSFYASSSEKMRIHSNGNVGIGTTSPSSKLDVNIPLGTSNGITIDTNDEVYSIWSNSNLGGLALSANIVGYTTRYDLFLKHSNGNVGIGTANPRAKLHVNNGLNGTTAITNSSTDYSFYTDAVQTNTYQGLLGTGENSTVTAAIHSFDDGSGAAQGLIFSTGNNTSLNERIRIKANGNVGIGTTSPETKLDVSGQIRSNDSFLLQSGTTAIGSIRNQGGALDIRGDSTRDISLGSVTNPQALFVEGTNGNVGIGTTSPVYKLDVNGSVNASFGDTNGYRVNTNRVLSQISGVVEVGVLDYKTTYPNISFNSDNTFRVQQNGSTKIIVNSSGNVGIGTTSPSQKLQVQGGGVQFITSNDHQRLFITSSSSKQSIIYFGDASSSTQGRVAYDNSSDSMYFNTASSEKMRILANGNVGIGTASPSQKLEVNGQVLSDGYRLAAMQTAPATRNSTGTLGEIVIDGNHIYVCYATDSWSRVALETSW